MKEVYEPRCLKRNQHGTLLIINLLHTNAIFPHFVILLWNEINFKILISCIHNFFPQHDKSDFIRIHIKFIYT